MNLSRQDISNVLGEYRRTVGELQYSLGDFGAMNDLHALFHSLPEGPLSDTSLAKLAVIISKSNGSWSSLPINLAVRRSINSFLGNEDSKIRNFVKSADTFAELDSQHLLTEANISFFYSEGNIYFDCIVGHGLGDMKRAGILTQENLNLLIDVYSEMRSRIATRVHLPRNKFEFIEISAKFMVLMHKELPDFIRANFRNIMVASLRARDLSCSLSDSTIDSLKILYNFNRTLYDEYRALVLTTLDTDIVEYGYVENGVRYLTPLEASLWGSYVLISSNQAAYYKARTIVDLYRFNPTLLRENKGIFTAAHGLDVNSFQRYIDFNCRYKNHLSEAIIELYKTRPTLLTAIQEIAARTSPSFSSSTYYLPHKCTTNYIHTPWKFLFIFHELQKAGLLITENEIAVLAKVGQVGYLSNIIKSLSYLNLLNQRNLVRALANTNAHHERAFHYLQRAMANQTNVDGMFDYAHILFSTEVEARVRNLPPHLETQATFDDIFAACRNAGGDVNAAKENVIALLRRLLDPTPQAALGGGQSTHTASIHRSTSESAIRLKSCYAAQLSSPGFIDQQLVEARLWLAGEHTGCLSFFRRPATLTPARAAALRGLDSIIRKPTPENLTASVGDHIDPVSNVSVRETTVLLWYAIHDKTQRQGNLGDALKRFEDALYELRREYNFDESGVDINPRVADRPACAGGTFNKLYEKFIGVFAFVQQILLTPAQVGLKLPKIVYEEALAYIKRQPESLRAIEITRLSTDGVSIIWPSIVNSVTGRVRNEFGSIFTTPGSLEACVAAGEYSVIDISRLERELPNTAVSSAAAPPLMSVAPLTGAGTGLSINLP